MLALTPRIFASSRALSASTPAHCPFASLKPNGGETPIAQFRTPRFWISAIFLSLELQAALSEAGMVLRIGGGLYAFARSAPLAVEPTQASPIVASEMTAT